MDCRLDGRAHGLSGLGGRLADGGRSAVAPRQVLSPDEQAFLVEGIRRGDPSAEELLIVAFQRSVLCMLTARTREPEASRDLAQEALMAALRAIREGRLRQADRLAGFVAGTACNLALKYQRSRRADPLPLELAPEPAGGPALALVMVAPVCADARPPSRTQTSASTEGAPCLGIPSKSLPLATRSSPMRSSMRRRVSSAR